MQLREGWFYILNKESDFKIVSSIKYLKNSVQKAHQNIETNQIISLNLMHDSVKEGFRQTLNVLCAVLNLAMQVLETHQLANCFENTVAAKSISWNLNPNTFMNPTIGCISRVNILINNLTFELAQQIILNPKVPQ